MQQAIHNQYWCHICKRQFISAQSDNVLCQFCSSEFCELIDPQNDPRSFVPFGEPPRQPQAIISITTYRNNIPIQRNLFDHLLTTMFPQTQFQVGQSMESLMEFISRNDPNRYGTPPASKTSIDKLIKVTLPQEQCTVCQEEYSQDSETLKMPCQHHFHQDCIVPWLQLHNSCPVCRLELPTDDQEYNSKKKLQ